MSAISGKIAAGAKTIYRVVISIAVWSVIALAGYLLFPTVSTYLSAFQLLTIVVAVNATATIILWREAARKAPRPNKKFLKNLLYGESITPKHDPPKVAGGEYASLACDVDRRFFADFAAFADVVNWSLAEEYVGRHWCLQELPDGDVSLNVDFSDGPTLGRCYAIFHNQVRLGRLEIRPGYKYSTETPNVLTEIELGSVRLLSFDNIVHFLGAIAMHICDDTQTSGEYGKYTDANKAIVGATTKALWQTQQITEFEEGQDWGELSLHLNGLVTPWYFDRREALGKRP
jgi:hypothetical protein